jgi:hypothetical protein
LAEVRQVLVENFGYDAVSAERWARSHAAVFSVNGTVACDEAEAAIDLVVQALDVAGPSVDDVFEARAFS